MDMETEMVFQPVSLDQQRMTIDLLKYPKS